MKEKIPEANNNDAKTGWEVLAEEDRQSAQERVIAFWEKNKDEIEETIRPFVEQFESSDKSKIISRLRKYGVAASCAALFSILEDTLDVDVIECSWHTSSEMEKAGHRNCGGLSKNGGVIWLEINEEDKDSRDEELALRKYNYLAHELFHQWQYGQIEKDGPRAALYLRENMNYSRPGANPEGYLCQFIELEAMRFGQHVEAIMEKALHDENVGA